MEDDEKASLACPVCMVPYDTGKRTPKMMPCLHTVCATCIVDLITAQVPPPPDNVYGRQSSAPSPEVYEEVQEDSNIYDNSDDENYEVISPSPPPPPPPQQKAFGQRMTNRHEEGTPISNIAHILQGHPLPNLRRYEGIGNQKETVSSPPVLPARNRSFSSGPPLVKPKPSAKQKFVPSKEPTIPRNFNFQCPVCRTTVDSAKLQTNRYVLAHLKDLERLMSPPTPTAAPAPAPVPTQKVRAPRPPDRPRANSTFVPEQFWCTTCAKPCTEGCISHNYQPLQLHIQNVRRSLQDTTANLGQRLEEHANNLKITDDAFKDIFQTLTKASRHLWKVNKNTEELKEHLTGLEDFVTTTMEAPSSPQQALALTAKMDCIRNFDKQLSSLESGANNDEIFIWRQNNKLYISTREPDQTIMIAVNEST